MIPAILGGTGRLSKKEELTKSKKRVRQELCALVRKLGLELNNKS